jgi:hypothetical protein
MAAVLIVTAGTIGVVAAQEADFRPVSNPFQEGFSYLVGEDLTPNVDVEGVRWTLVRMAARGDREIEEGKDVPITVDLEFENRREDGVKVVVVLLLEDGNGGGLERIRFDPFRAGSGRFRASKQKFRVAGDALLATRTLYLFCELQE